MGVLNDNPSLASIINGLDDRLRALEQSKRFVVPYTGTAPANPLNGEEWFDTTTKQAYVNDNGMYRTLLNGSWSSATATFTDTSNTGHAVGLGAWTAFTPTWTANTVVTLSVNSSRYVRIGRTIIANYYLFAGAVNGANTWAVTYPVPMNTNAPANGIGFCNSGGGSSSPVWMAAGTSNAVFYSTQTGSIWSPAVAVGGYLQATVVYEAAND